MLLTELIAMGSHFNYFLILNNHVNRGFKYHPVPGVEPQAAHTEGIGAPIQLALMSVESLTLQAAIKHNLQVTQIKSAGVGDLKISEGTIPFGKLL